MNLVQAVAFKDELGKEAATPNISTLKRMYQMAAGTRALPWMQRLRSAGVGAVRTGVGTGVGRAAIGAGLGAGTGALVDGQEGAVRGALIGAGAGYASPLLTSKGRAAAGAAVKRFGQRQKHGVTGKGDFPLGPKATTKEIEALQKARESGLTSIPGIARGLAKSPKKTLKDAWRQTDRMGKLMAVGDVGLSAPRIADSTTQEGYGEKVLGTLGSSGGYLLGSRMPIAGSLLLAGGAGLAGKYLGRGMDKTVGYKPKPKPQLVPPTPGRLLSPGAQ